MGVPASVCFLRPGGRLVKWQSPAREKVSHQRKIHYLELDWFFFLTLYPPRHSWEVNKIKERKVDR